MRRSVGLSRLNSCDTLAFAAHCETHASSDACSGSHSSPLKTAIGEQALGYFRETVGEIASGIAPDARLSHSIMMRLAWSGRRTPCILPDFRRIGHPLRRRISLRWQLGEFHRRDFHPLAMPTSIAATPHRTVHGDDGAEPSWMQATKGGFQVRYKSPRRKWLSISACSPPACRRALLVGIKLLPTETR